MTVYNTSGRTALAWLAHQWPGLYLQDPDATPYSQHGWLQGWARQLPEAATPLMLLARDDQPGIAAGLALAWRDRGNGAAHVTALAPSEYVTAVGPRAHHPEVAEALADALTGLADLGASVSLPNVPARSALGSALLCREAWRHTASPTAIVPLPWNPAVLKASDKRQHRHQERRLAAPDEHGHRPTIAYRRSRNRSELQAAIPVLMALRAARYGRDEWAARTDWSDILRSTENSAFIATLLADGRPIAAQLVLTRRTRAFSALPGMDPAEASRSPGHALLRRLLADLTERGYTALDLGPTINRSGQIKYKGQYGPDWGSNVTVVHQNGSLTTVPSVPPQGRRTARTATHPAALP